MFVVRFSGGLGNQLFQYNFLCYLRKFHPLADIRVDTKSFYRFDNPHCGFNLKIKIRQAPSGYESFCKIITDETFTDDFSDLDNIAFEGYWQNLRFFYETYFDINDVCESSLSNNEYYEMIKKFENSIFVHVRRGDYVKNYVFCNVATKVYFQNAIDKASELLINPHFFVFSNDASWASENLNFRKNDVTFVHGDGSNKKSVVSDLLLMSACSHGIISNSSYSWWAQHLILNHNKKIFSPEYWINEDITENNCGVVNIQCEPHFIKIPNIGNEDKVIRPPLVTFVLYFKNSEHRMKNVFSSLFNQSEQSFSIIAVDDNSTDKTFSILQYYASLDCRITIVHNSTTLGLFNSIVAVKPYISGKYFNILCENTYLDENAMHTVFMVISKEQKDAFRFKHTALGRYEKSAELCISDMIFLTEKFSDIFSSEIVYPRVYGFYTEFFFRTMFTSKVDLQKQKMLNIITVPYSKRDTSIYKRLGSVLFNANELEESGSKYILPERIVFSELCKNLDIDNQLLVLDIILSYFFPSWFCKVFRFAIRSAYAHKSIIRVLKHIFKK